LADTAAATHEPEFLTARRARAVDALGTLELPSFRGIAGWEFTPIDKLDLDAHPPTPGAPLADDRTPLKAAAHATTDGVTVLPIVIAAERHPELVEQHLGTIATRDDPFTARNAAHFTDGWFVHVAANTKVDEPIVLGLAHVAGTLHHRTLVVIDEGAEAEVWDQLASETDDADGVANGVVELVVGHNATLRYVGAQDLNQRTWVFGSQRAVVQRDGTLEWITLGFGAADGKVFVETNLAGPGADARVTGAYATRARQHLDFDTLQEHAAPNTTSDLAYRGILADRSSAVWRGMIKVDPGAQHTDAFQESRNLLVSHRAHADAIPGLEILADDVRCTHAAAIAQIDPEQLFYLRARGLPEPQARQLVIEGFLSALLERLPQGELRDAVAGALDARLSLVLQG
jgi:Fe-S cluster assembly protein SufD